MARKELIKGGTIIMAQDKITWEDEYAKKHKDEWPTAATCIIDGYRWRVDEEGRTYCAGKSKGGDNERS